jgi:hypothetical protein
MTPLKSSRRTHYDNTFGLPLVPLEKPEWHYWEVSFPPEEKLLYRHIEERFRQLINQWFAKGQPIKNLTYLIVQTTRLRQFVFLTYLMSLIVLIVSDWWLILFSLNEKLR